MHPNFITMYLNPRNHELTCCEFDGYPINDIVGVSEFVPLWAFNLALAARARGESDFEYRYKGYLVDIWWD